jgi:hypothetical protein
MSVMGTSLDPVGRGRTRRRSEPVQAIAVPAGRLPSALAGRIAGLVEQAVPRLGGEAGFELLAHVEARHERLLAEAFLEACHVVGCFKADFGEGDAAFAEQGARVITGLVVALADIKGDRVLACRLAGGKRNLGIAAVGLQVAFIELLDRLGWGLIALLSTQR